MKLANLYVLAQGFSALPPQLLAAYEAQLSEREEALSAIKPHEAASVVSLVQELRANGAGVTPHLEGFAFSFSIPQISSEFDLLKICEQAVVNIELKSEDVGVRRIEEQLRRTRHYLAPLCRTVRTFTYVTSSNRLFELSEQGGVRHVRPSRLVRALAEAGKPHEGQVEELFKVSNYLVSPINDPQKFLEGRYFLTNHQMQIKASFITACASGNATPPAFMVFGSAGTGKTLLLYDLAHALELPRPACVIHCGVLTEGHELLNKGQDGFHVISAKKSERVDFTQFGALLVDEAQRMWPSQLKRVISAARDSNIPLFLSLDRRQVLMRRDDTYDIEHVVRDVCPHASVWELSRKIRTNRELANFIRALFGLRGKERFVHTSHVKLACSRDAREARDLVDAFRVAGYQYIALGPADDEDELQDLLTIPGCPDPSTVVGQEFDKVVMALGPKFSLDENYAHRQLLYQGLTRARSEIALVVYGNESMVRRLLELVSA